MDNGSEALSPTQAEKLGPFGSPADLLKHIINGAMAVAVNVRRPDFRAVYPSYLTDDEHDDLIQQHLSGNLKPRLCTGRDTSFEVEDHSSLGAYIIQRHPDGSCTTPCLCFDFDGADHVAGRTFEQVLAIVLLICDVLEAAGLPYFLEYSHGGQGIHLWLLFEKPLSAAFVKELGDLVIFAAGSPTGIEVFPKQATIKEGRLGNPIALPLPGKKVSARGGDIINRDLSVRSVDTIQCIQCNDLEPLIDAWKKFENATARITAAEKSLSNFNSLIYGKRTPPNDFSDVGLDAVCRELGEITDDRDEEDDIIKLNCPRHNSSSRKSLHVNVEDRWWRCCSCGDSGGGATAEFSLAVWLMPHASEDDVQLRLKSLRQKPVGDANA